jgi:hypothetical protein
MPDAIQEGMPQTQSSTAQCRKPRRFLRCLHQRGPESDRRVDRARSDSRVDIGDLIAAEVRDRGQNAARVVSPGAL